jgi:hypothetical protein
VDAETAARPHTDITLSLTNAIPDTTVNGGFSTALTLGSPGVAADSNGGFHPFGEHAEVSFTHRCPADFGPTEPELLQSGVARPGGIVHRQGLARPGFKSRTAPTIQTAIPRVSLLEISSCCRRFRRYPALGALPSGWQNHCHQSHKQSGTLQLPFKLFGYAFRYAAIGSGRT